MAIDRALADLEEAKREAIRLSALLDSVHQRIRKLEIYIEMAESYESPSASAAPVRLNASPIVPACISILRAHGTRMPARQLVEELERRGVLIGGTNKITNLSGTLSRAPEFSASRLDGWGLAEWEGNTTKAPPAADDFAAVNIAPFDSEITDEKLPF
jgi:hypothetical protein